MPMDIPDDIVPIDFLIAHGMDHLICKINFKFSLVYQSTQFKYG